MGSWKTYALPLASLTALVGASSASAVEAHPDLAVTEVAPRGTAIVQGHRLYLVTTVTNRGFVFADASWSVSYLSADRRRSKDDVRLGDARIPRVANTSRSRSGARFVIPADTAPRRYWVITCADVTSAVAEAVETNNCKASRRPINVVPPPPDRAPVPGVDVRATPHNAAVIFAPGELTANDRDPEGAPLRVVAVGNPIGGRVAIDPAQTVTFTPAAGFTGQGTFEYRVSDGVNIAIGTVAITVT